MLKKLSRYGNSTTLVIDKAILELLNMSESSMVKLQTDGKSLIITPVEPSDDKKVTYEGLEALDTALVSKEKKMINKKSDTPLDVAKMQEEYSQVFKKHQQIFTKFNQEIFLSQNFQDALTLLAETLDPVKQSEEYLKEFNQLKFKFCPELELMQNEIEELHKKYS